MDFNVVMRNHSDEKIVEILQKRNDYQKEAIDAALIVAKERGLLNLDESIDKYDISPDDNLDAVNFINDLENEHYTTIIILKNIGIVFLVINILPAISGLISFIDILLNGIIKTIENSIAYLFGIMILPISSIASIWMLSIAVKHLKKNIEFTLSEVKQFKFAIVMNIFLSSLNCTLFAFSNITSQSLILRAMTLFYIFLLVYIYKLNLIFFKGKNGSWFNYIRLIILVMLVFCGCSILISLL